MTDLSRLYISSFLEKIEVMATCSAKRICFLIFNFLFLIPALLGVAVYLCISGMLSSWSHFVIGSGLLGFVAWTLATIPNASQFLTGTWIFQLTVFGLGVMVTITGILGCFGGLCQTYVGLMVTLMFLQIGLVIAIYVEHAQISSIIASSWEGLNLDTKYELQKELKCCGINNYTEYGTDVADLPDSCFRPYDVTNTIDKKMDNLYTANCLDSMMSWIQNNMAVWVASLLVIAVIQLLSAVLSCVYLNRAQQKAKVKPKENIEMESTEKTNKESADNVTVTDLEPAGKALVMSSLKDKDVDSLTEGSVVMGDLEPDHWESHSINGEAKEVTASLNESQSGMEENPVNEKETPAASSTEKSETKNDVQESQSSSPQNNGSKDKDSAADTAKAAVLVGAVGVSGVKDDKSVKDKHELKSKSNDEMEQTGDRMSEEKTTIENFPNSEETPETKTESFDKSTEDTKISEKNGVISETVNKEIGHTELHSENSNQASGSEKDSERTAVTSGADKKGGSKETNGNNEAR